MISQKQHTNVSSVSLAWSLAADGRIDEAFDGWNGESRPDTLIGFLHIYTERFAPLLSRDPRFIAILEQLGLATSRA